jgi:hypothetical protein
VNNDEKDRERANVRPNDGAVLANPIVGVVLMGLAVGILATALGVGASEAAAYIWHQFG